MYASGEYVVHGYSGLCLVEDVTCLKMPGVNKDALYYILRPLNSEDSKIYLPVEGDRGTGRRIMTKEEAVRFMKAAPETEELWTPNHKVREELYKKAMRTCDCGEWIRIIKTLYLKQTERDSIGKRLSASDERFLKQAEDYLYTELSLAMGSSKEEMHRRILELTEQKETASA